MSSTVRLLATIAAMIIALIAIMVVSAKSASAGTCADGLAAIGRTLPFAGLEPQDRYTAHTMLRRAYAEAEHGDEAACRQIAGDIIARFLAKPPVQHSMERTGT